MLQITSICLDGQHISKLSGLEQLVNLRWASFNDNYITKIEVSDRLSWLAWFVCLVVRRVHGALRLNAVVY